jgi:hypothetical protein
LGHASASRSRTMRQNSRAVAASAAISGERRSSSSRKGRACSGCFSLCQAALRGEMRGGLGWGDCCFSRSRLRPYCFCSQSRNVWGRPAKLCACNSRQSCAALWHPCFQRCSRYWRRVSTDEHRRLRLRSGNPPALSQRRTVFRLRPHRRPISHWDRAWSHRERKVTPRRHPVPDLIQVSLQILLEHRERFPIHTDGATVGFHQLPRPQDKVFGNTVWLCLRHTPLPLRVDPFLRLAGPAPSPHPSYRASSLLRADPSLRSASGLQPSWGPPT